MAHTISTEQFETPIFGPDIGTNVNKFIGNIIDSYTISKVKDEIVEAVSLHDRVVSIEYVNAFSIVNDVYVIFGYTTDDADFGVVLMELG
mgnify:CR=1 FL=1